MKKNLARRLQAFEILARQNEAMLTAFTRSIISDHALADDVAQMAWIVAWKKLETLKDPRSFPAWLRSIARFEAMNALRKRKREGFVELTEMQAVDEAFSRWDQPEGGPDFEAAASTLEECYDELPDGLRLVCREHYFQNLKAREISDRNQLNLATVLKRLERCREALRICMQAKLNRSQA